MDPEIKRFAQRVRSEVREYVRRERQPPPLMVFASKGKDPRKIASAPAGHGRSAGDVARNIREFVLEARASFAAVALLLHEEDRRTRSRVLAVVAASADGWSFTWGAGCTAGVLTPWEDGEFDAGEIPQLLRTVTVEARRRAGLDVLFEKVYASARGGEDDAIVEELLGGLDALRGNPLAQALLPQKEDVFMDRVSRWLERGEGAVWHG